MNSDSKVPEEIRMAKADDLKAKIGPSSPPLARIDNAPPNISDHQMVLHRPSALMPVLTDLHRFTAMISTIGGEVKNAPGSRERFAHSRRKARSCAAVMKRVFTSVGR